MSESAIPREVRERTTRLLAALGRYRAGLARDGGEPLRDPRDLARESGTAACLLQRVDELETLAGHQRRRIELVERAVSEEGLERELAEEAYDIAREEGLEPAFGLELVRCGVAVCEPPDSDLEATAAVRGHPEWLEPPVPSEEATRERRLRLSFRRLRRFLEERPTPEEALVAFAAEPDVAECEF
jgi:hypothetical protein